ncbi:zinc ribbon domain-containing protein [Sphingomonas sp. HF-S4]|uniref:Zinc ribbon domain-containing protein n=1 Tax=Sphingomonas agrestis TaxID=3080540 RepID=A0ABU3YA67_9SPHN|nr:zinc ribbon domain-containing protein [Sphingomonas sp. HF-S4]MDV3458052.1 zinc ribbon domain-containing protein [Sphingomonas sp. HF-S4]
MAFCSQCGTALPDNARFCPKCGEAVTADAEPVPTPAPPAVVHATPGPLPERAAPPPRSGRGGLILPVLLVLALAVIGFALWSQRDGARPIAGDNASEAVEAPEKAGDAPASEEKTEQTAETRTSTTAASLDSAFNADPQGARARYPGPVTVSGTVATMVTPGSTPALSLEGRTKFNYIVANFPSGTREQLAGVAKGDRVALACRSVTAIAGTTMLQGCALE